MSLKIPYFRKGAKGTAKSGSAPLRDIKNKKTSYLTRGGNSDYTAHDWITVSTVPTAKLDWWRTGINYQ